MRTLTVEQINSVNGSTRESDIVLTLFISSAITLGLVATAYLQGYENGQNRFANKYIDELFKLVAMTPVSNNCQAETQV